MPPYTNIERLCEKIKNYKCFGLNEALKLKCGTLYILDNYYDKFKNKIDQKDVEIYLYNLASIEKAAQLIRREHKISVIGF